MRSSKLGKHRKNASLLSLLFLLSLTATLLFGCSDPPDVPVCTAFPAIDWPKMRETFYKLCGDDPACAPQLADWKKKISKWSDPSDAGWCKHVVGGKEFDIDDAHPAPFKDKKGKPVPWKDILEGSVIMPAKESWAPFKTWVQTNCRKNKSKCKNGIGNWESTVKAIDGKVAK